MKKVESIWAELSAKAQEVAQESTELSEEVKVELALVNDIEKEFKKMQSATELIEREGKRIGKEIFDFRDTYNSYKATTFITLLQKYKSAAQDLGVDIDSKYDKAIEDYQQTRKTFQGLIR